MCGIAHIFAHPDFRSWLHFAVHFAVRSVGRRRQLSYDKRKSGLISTALPQIPDVDR